jgi:TonB-linked SusC/RagA family outer membrane protein
MKATVRPLNCVAWLVAVVLGLANAPAALGQAAVIAGRVTNEVGAPVPGATVTIIGTNLGRQAADEGNYSITLGAEYVGQTVTALARAIGHGPQQRTLVVQAGTQTVNFSIRRDPFGLAEVVVTGTAAATEQRKLPFTVARVSEEELREVPASSPAAALAGKVSGARITTGVGSPGAPPAIRLRGSTNLGIGSNAPLIIIDGVISRANISDLDANAIESIEVIKGAAGAAYYGSNAATGVINITTKRGRDSHGRVTVISRNEYGASGLERMIDLNRSHPYVTNPDGSIFLSPSGQRTIKAGGVADTPYPTEGPYRWRNQLEEWSKDGQFYSSNLQVGMRRDNTNFHSSFTTDHNAGVVPVRRGQYRQNARMNIDQVIGADLDLSLGVTYGTSKNDHPIRAGNNNLASGAEPWFALLQAPPDIDLNNPWFGYTQFTPSAFMTQMGRPISDDPNDPNFVRFMRPLPDIVSPSARGNPLYAMQYESYGLRRDRLVGSASARYRPFDWLTLDANYGTDRLSSRQDQFQFKGYQTEGGTPGQGRIDRNANNISAYNAATGATARYSFPWMQTTTRIAFAYDQFRQNFFNTVASKLNVTDLPDLSGADPAQLFVNSEDQLERTVNYLASQSFDIRDRYIIDAMIRRDGSSLFGSDTRWQNFYRVAAAWLVSEDFQLPGINELKLRGARGTAGLRPGFFDQYEAYSVGAGQITKFQLGNKELRPAVQTENEYGVNVTFADRFDLEVVRADRKTRGAFIAVPLSLAQSGGFQTQVQNAADVSAKTTEIMFRTRLINRPEFTYQVGLTADRTTQNIDKLGRAPFRVGGLGQGQDMFYYKEGESLGIMYGTRWIRTFEELIENPANASAVESNYVVNPLGYLVLASGRGTRNERPIPYVNAAGETQHVIGDVNPSFNFGLSNSVRWRGFSLYGLFDGQRGGDVYNFSKQWMFQDHRAGDLDQAGKPDDQKVAHDFYAAGLYGGLVANDYFVEDASFVKLRELSVAYTLGEGVIRAIGFNRYARGMKIALIGRNLKTWSSYSGFDPDVTAGTDFNFRVDGFRYPNFRTFTGQVEITF